MPTTKLTIHKGKDAEFELAGLLFRACRREVDVIDGGVTLQVYGPSVGGSDPDELLRFDCFRKGPHYHAPGAEPKETKIQAGDDARDWVFERLATDAPSLLEQGGFHELAKSLDTETLAAEVQPRLRALFDGLAEPSETSTFEVDSKLVEGLGIPAQ